MANTLAVQNKVARAVAFAWDDMPGICDHITWAEEGKKMNGVNLTDVDINPALNTGPTVNLRRPGRVDASMATVGYDYSLPSAVNPEVGYAPRIDATVPLTVNIRAEVNLQISIEELSLYLDAGQGRDRHIDPAIRSIKAKINRQIAYQIAQYSGQSLAVGSSQANWVQNWLQAATDAENLMVERNAMTYDEGNLVALVPGSTVSYMNANAAVVYNMTDDVKSAQGEGRPFRSLGGYKIHRSPLTGLQYIPATATVTTTADAGVQSGYAQTWTVPVTGLAASTLYKANTLFGFTVSGTPVNWINPLTKDDTGFQATFSLVNDVTTNSSGAANLTLAEAMVYGGAQRNTTLTAALPSGSSVNIIGAGASASSARNSFLFTPRAIIGVSPDIVVPEGIHNVKQWRQDGVSITIGSATHPTTWQEITKIVVLAGVAALIPEGITRLTNSK